MTKENLNINAATQQMSAKIIIVPSILALFSLYLASFDETMENDKCHEVF